MVRLPGVCNHNEETTVLAHVRLVGISGMGMKAPDFLGAWACDSCHACYDRRHKADLSLDYVQKSFLEGVLRTQYELIKSGTVEL